MSYQTHVFYILSNYKPLYVKQAWTNGRLKSVIHRAVVNKEKQRLSMAYFMNPTSSATIECPPQLIDSVSNPRKYVPFTWVELGTFF